MPPKCYKCGTGTYGHDYGYSRSSHGDKFPLCKSCEKVEYYHPQKGEHYKEDAASVRVREEAAKRYLRLQNVDIKICSECNQKKAHDPNDYMCITCRDQAA